MKSYLLMGGLFLAVSSAPAVLAPTAPPASTLFPGIALDSADVPPEAREALRQGRYFRASRILREYLAQVPDPQPETILMAAQAEAGWGDWQQVQSLLSGRAWLDTVAGGYGWRLLGRSRLELGQLAEADEALRQYLRLATTAGDQDRGIVVLRRAEALSRGSDVAGALRAYAEAAELLPQIEDWIAIRAATAAAAAGDTTAVRTWLERSEPGLASDRGWRAQVRGRRAVGDHRGALTAAEAAVARIESAARRAEAWQAVGELRLMLGDTGGARTAFRQAIAAAPGSSFALDAGRSLGSLPGATADDRLRIGRLFLRHGNLERGLAGLRAYLDAGAGNAAERAEVRLELGRALFRAERYRDAEQVLLALAEQAPNSRVGAEALFQAGRAQYRQGKNDQGRATFLRTAERHPHEAAAARALFLVADLDHDAERLTSAQEFYRRTVATGSDVAEVGLAWMRLAGIAYAAADYETALRLFEEYRERYPTGRRTQQAAYWSALTYRQLGRSELAQQRLREVWRADPLSYYGGQAAQGLGEPLSRTPMEASPPRNENVEAEVAGALARLDLLRQLGWDEAATFEVERLRRHFAQRDGALYALAEAFNERGYTMTGISIGWEIYRRENIWNPRLLRIIYPFPYREIIIAEARDRGVNPFLAAGLIRQESMFNATAVSPAGAIGLMQIMPATGRALARTHGVANFAPDMLRKPELNISLGVAYMDEMLRRYQGRLTSVLAAYNAGPSRVTRWSQFPEFRDDELFAERIPFEETRSYVKVVQQNARIYAALYDDQAADRLGE
jgi:soluble lytic murein transglycosylase